MKNDKERKDWNQVLISRDMGDLTKRHNRLYNRIGMSAQTPEGLTPTFLGTSTEDSKVQNSAAAPKDGNDKETNKKTQDPTKKSKDLTHDTKKAGKKNKTAEAKPNDDYMKAYLKKKAEKEKEIKEKQKENAVTEAQEKAKQLKIDTEHRVRARDIQNQIRLWESYRTQPGYDETLIDAMIVTLRTQLNGIDPKYWY